MDEMDAWSEVGETDAGLVEAKPQPTSLVQTTLIPVQHAPKKRTVEKRSEFHRMNFLVQASTLMVRQSVLTTSSALSSEQSNTEKNSLIASPMARTTIRSSKKCKNSKPVSLVLENEIPSSSLSRILALQSRQVGQKAVLRMAPEIKQRICPRCSLQLEPGVTSSIRFRRNRSKVLFKVTTCLSCKTVSRIRMDPKYEPSAAGLPAEEVS